MTLESKYEVDVNGVNPEGGFQEFLEKELDDMMDAAPSDASVSGYVTKIKDGYTGIVNIVSSQGRFVAKAVSQDLNDIVMKMKKQIDDQLSAWRDRRHFENGEDDKSDKALWQKAIEAVSLRKPKRMQPA